MKVFFLILVFLQSVSFGSIEFSDFDSYQGKWTREEMEERLKFFLQKDDRLKNFFSLNDDHLILFNGLENPKIEYRLRLAKKKNQRGSKKIQRSNLVGLKVAIDPGHLGGIYARLEERYIDIPPSLIRENSIQFDEGTLSFLTALYLKILLEKEGAIVLITREGIGKGVYEEDFFDWLKKNPDLWSKDMSLNHLFRKNYNPLDLRARAKKINQFSPDLTVVVHYNSHDVDEKRPSNFFIAAQNYNMVFVPGAFGRNELLEKESRYEFIRLLCSEDLDQSIRLSKIILNKFEKHLNVPTVSNKDGANYLSNVCLKVAEGVYARNLALTRLIHGPVCYGETLIQNNIDECVYLSRKDFVIGGFPCSSRVKEVAESYFEGIKSFLLEFSE